MSTEDNGRLQLYQRVCESYHNIDDFRMKLLGLLPVATGAGVFLLLSGKADLLDNAPANATAPANAQESLVPQALAAIGIFGFLFTLGLFAYELFGIKKCHYLIRAGTKLEDELKIRGQFRSRPEDVAGFVAEPFASSIIYPASMAAWLFLGLFFVFDEDWWVAPLAASLVVVGGSAGTMYGVHRIKRAQKAEDHLLDLLREHGPIELSQSRDDFGSKRLRAVARRLEKRHEVEIVEDKKVLLLDDRAPSPVSTGDATPGNHRSGQLSGAGRAQ
jgi:hypothetical protein